MARLSWFLVARFNLCRCRMASVWLARSGDVSMLVFACSLAWGADEGRWGAAAAGAVVASVSRGLPGFTAVAQPAARARARSPSAWVSPFRGHVLISLPLRPRLSLLILKVLLPTCLKAANLPLSLSARRFIFCFASLLRLFT